VVNKKKLKFLIDVDGPLCEIHDPWLAEYNEDFEDTLTVADIHGWNIEDIVKPACGTQIFKYLNRKSVYEKAQVSPGALEAVSALSQLGDVYYLTAGLFSPKFEWLDAKGFLSIPGLSAKSIIVCEDKSMIEGDVIVDDRVANMLGVRRLRIIYSKPWNFRPWHPNIPMSYRIDSWSHIMPKIISNVVLLNGSNVKYESVY
jgi:5'(3')-deoxyribonucleotidase